MYDLAPPSTKYDEENNKLRQAARNEDSKYTAADRSTDRNKRLTANGHRTKRDRFNKYSALLIQESKAQAMSRQFTIKRLAREKAHWFAHCRLLLCDTLRGEVDRFNRSQIPNIVCRNIRKLYSSSLSFVAHGCGLLFSVCASHAFSWNSGIPHTCLIRQGLTFRKDLRE